MAECSSVFVQNLISLNNMSMIIYTLQIVGKILSIVLPLLISVAYFTLAERKIMGAMQRRKGPNVVGTFTTSAFS